MSKAFNIKPGKYDIPKIGKVDANEEVSEDKAFEIYKLPRRVFPWISLGPDAESFLKKQKLKKEDVSKMIQNAATPEEVELLSGLSSAKVVERITDIKLKSFEK